MAEYNGDIMFKTGNVYQRKDERNYVVAAILAVLFGAIGIHRFYLNDMRTAFLYFVPFAITCLIGAAMLDFTLLLWYLALAAPILVIEIGYFIYRWLQQ